MCHGHVLRGSDTASAACGKARAHTCICFALIFADLPVSLAGMMLYACEQREGVAVLKRSSAVVVVCWCGCTGQNAARAIRSIDHADGHQQAASVGKHLHGARARGHDGTCMHGRV